MDAAAADAAAAACSAGPDPVALATEIPLIWIEDDVSVMICDGCSALWESPWQRDPQIGPGWRSSSSSYRTRDHSLAGSQIEEGNQTQSWACSCLESTRFEQASVDKQMAMIFCFSVCLLLAVADADDGHESCLLQHLHW